MTFSYLKDQFLIENPDYSNDVKNFMAYIERVRKLRIPEQEDFLVEAISTKKIIKSLQYFIDRGQIKKQEPAKKYFVSIGQLFEYVLTNSSYKNDNFLQELANPSTREDSYRRKTNDFILSCDKLEPKEPFAKFDDALIIDLINWCDKSIDANCDEQMCDTDFKRMAAALCMKLIMLTGATYRVVRKILLTDLNAQQNTININHFRIRLPLKLSLQFQNYKKYRERFLPGNLLFVDASGNQWGDATSSSGIPSFMNTAIKQTNLTGLVKYGISQLIQSGINDSVIMKFTDANREILNSCLDDIERNNNFWEQYINSKLVTTDRYYQL